VKSVVVDPEVMRDLVYDGDPDLLDNLLVAVTDRQDWMAKDQDSVWQAGVVLTAFGERDARVEPEYMRQIRRRIVLHQDHAVVDQRRQLGRNLVQSLSHEQLEFLGRHVHARATHSRSLDRPDSQPRLQGGRI
jgi:hypothetical protein